MAKFDLNDDGVVVIVGSGAGGGTLGNELAQKGAKVVILEAGGRHEIQDFVNDEWASFAQLAWTDMRTTSGTWLVHRDFPNLPAWIVKSVGGSTVHWAGASLRFEPHEFKARTTYGDIAGANLLDWPLTAEEMAPWYARAEDKMGMTTTNNIPGLPGNNNFKVLQAGATKLGYTQVNTGRMSINSQPRDGRGSCQQIGFCFQGCKSGAKWSTLYTEIPKGEATGRLEVRPNSMALRIEHNAAGRATGVLYADENGNHQFQKARVVAVAGNSIESPRLLLNSASSTFPDGLANSSGQVGRNYMRHLTGSVYATFGKPVHMYRGTTMAGIVRDEARNDPKRGFVGGYELETLSLGLAFYGRLPQSRRLGPQLHQCDGRLRQHRRPVDRRRRHAAGDQPRDTRPHGQGQARAAGRQRPFRRPRERHRDAQPRLPAGLGDLRGGRRNPRLPDAALSQHAQHGHQPHEREAARRGGEQVRPDARRREPVRLRRQPVHHRRRLQPDADDRVARDPPSRPHQRADGARRALSASRP